MSMGNKLILVAGYCAAGKSTFSRRLAQELHIPCFNKDIVKEILGDGFGPESGEVFQKGSRVTFMLLRHIAECFLEAGKICVLESNFRAGEIRQLCDLLAKYDGECLTFLLTGDLNVLYERYLDRDKASNRSWVHKPAGSDREAFKNGQLQFGEIAAGKTIPVDTTSFENMDYEHLLAIAKEFAG